MWIRLLCFVILFSITSQLLAMDYQISLTSMPNQQELTKLKSLKGNVQLNLCCSYPSLAELQVLEKFNVKAIHITAGHYPTSNELLALEKSNLEYQITAEEAFPSQDEANRLNQSRIKLLTVSGRDFPTQGEIMAYNMFNIPFRLDMLKKEFPTYEHMIVIRQIKKQHSVAFYNPIPPGPGYADFFNALSAHKIFVITDKFPYGDDAVGINMLTNASVEIRPDQRLMPQDLPIINAINIKTIVALNDHWPVNQEYMSMLQAIKHKNLEIQDDGSIADYLLQLEQMSQQDGRQIVIGQDWH